MPNEPVPSMTVQFNVPSVMRDGTVLLANVYSPSSSELVPVLLTRHPYSKDNPFFPPLPLVNVLVRAGYIVVVQDVRGRFTSEGEFCAFSPSWTEHDDGYDTVAWASTLPGSNGQVGMWGLSYGSETQWSAALAGAPALTSMVSINGPTHSQFGGLGVRGGANELASRIGWSHASISLDMMLRENPTDPDALSKALDAYVSVDELFRSGEIYRIRPFDQLPAAEPFLLASTETMTDDLLAPRRWINTAAGRYDEIDQAVFLVGGWYDVFLGSTLGQYQGLLEQAQSTGRALPHLLMGPWAHVDLSERLGELSFGPLASPLFPGKDLDLSSQHVRWFDATLKGITAPLEAVAPVRAFVMGTNTWVDMTTFPPEPDILESWFLGANGSLSTDLAPAVDSVGYSYDPSDPAPTIGGAIMMLPPYAPGPLDQRPLYTRDDVVSFTSAELGADLTVIGMLSATLFASSSAVDTDFVVRLCDVYPDGRSIVISDSIIRASVRDNDGSRPDSGPEPSPIEPGRVYEYELDLWATGQTFLAGHSIRVDVTSSCFPRWDNNPNTGGSIYDSEPAVVAQQTIFWGGEYPSRVTLPVISSSRLHTGERLN